VCGDEFMNVIFAIRDLEGEMKRAYQNTEMRPGIAAEEVLIRMELNRLAPVSLTTTA
jgi:hypothetical protein